MLLKPNYSSNDALDLKHRKIKQFIGRIWNAMYYKKENSSKSERQTLIYYSMIFIGKRCAPEYFYCLFKFKKKSKVGEIIPAAMSSLTYSCQRSVNLTICEDTTWLGWKEFASVTFWFNKVQFIVKRPSRRYAQGQIECKFCLIDRQASINTCRSRYFSFIVGGICSAE